MHEELKPDEHGESALSWDGHTHTQFCPHGDGSLLESYILRAYELGLTRYSVTEHPPLPAGWLADADLQSQLAMQPSRLEDYFAAVQRCKDQYRERINIRCGLELDYLPCAESFTYDLVSQYRHVMDEAVVSVHFLPGQGGMRCVDHTAQDVAEGLLAHYGSMGSLLHAYYDHVEQAIRFASTLPMPTRVGHINLIEKFRLDLPEMDEGAMRERQERLLPLLAATGVGVDVNLAGLRKPSCGKPYVEPWFVEACRRQGTLCVFGSDAHAPGDVGKGLETFLTW
jgi:histidinol-phosphatase (PHP family)